MSCAFHQFVDVAIDIHVDRIGPGCGKRPANKRPDHQPDGRPASLRQHHGGNRGDQEQLNNAWLRERYIGADFGPLGGGLITVTKQFGGQT
jgi:hypothetical protein